MRRAPRRERTATRQRATRARIDDPGARRDSVEQYIKRLADVEEIANSFTGVEKSYAISGGREVRVFVKPEEMDDFKARELARNIANRIENELKYPGEIKVNVIREMRAIEFAR